jgi:hypothetical protein
MWLTALLAALTLPALSGGTTTLLAAGAVVVGGALVVVLSGHRQGFVTAIARWIASRRLGRFSAWVAEREGAFQAADAQLTELHRERPGQLTLAVAIDYLSRIVAVGELLLVAHAVGATMSLTAAVVISGLSALTVNLFFLLPWELGSREGSLYLLFGLAGIPASVGLVAAVLTRVRELVWAALGLALAGGRPAVDPKRP